MEFPSRGSKVERIDRVLNQNILFVVIKNDYKTWFVISIFTNVTF